VLITLLWVVAAVVVKVLRALQMAVVEALVDLELAQHCL
jgi:hypothetical protein